MDLELGKKFIEEKHFKKAFIFFLNKLKKGNNTVNTYFFLGLVCFELNKIKDSINYYKLEKKYFLMTKISTKCMINFLVVSKINTLG
jgi:hypothetical protein